MIGLILAGGKGTRLRPLTYFAPKPMLPIGGKPLLQHQIDYMLKYCERVIVSSNIDHGEIIDLVSRNNSDRVITSVERYHLGTAGAIKKALEFYTSRVHPKQFIVLNGDTIINADINALSKRLVREKADCVISVLNMKQKGAGNIKINRDGRIINFEYKNDQDGPSLISCGLYILTSKIISQLPEIGSFEEWTEKNYRTNKVFAQIAGCYPKNNEFYYLDIGTPMRYFKAVYDTMVGNSPLSK